MHRRRYLRAVGAGSMACLAGCLGGSGQNTDDYDVGMTINEFRPAELAVDPDTTVVFRNTSSHSHTVTAFQDAYPGEAEYWASGGHDSEAAAKDAWNSGGPGTLEPGDTYEHTFTVLGAYGYYCIPHLSAEMVGDIVVRDG